MMKDTHSWEHRFVETNGVRLHCVVHGQGKLMVLLHGFPEFWYSWRHQIPAMGKHFKVVAPDMRGYNDSDKPEGVENYNMDLLVEDVMGLIRAFGAEKAIIVGHDWGGVISWAFAMMHPEATERLIIMNAPHPTVWFGKTKHLPEQVLKSGYISFFLTENAPESYLSMDNYLILREMLCATPAKGKAFSEEDLEKFVGAWSKPGTLTAGINYYRANIKPDLSMKDVSSDFPKITSPTLVIWGEEDPFLTLEVSKGAEKHVDAPYKIRYIPNCGHWVQNEEPELVNEYMLEFLADLTR